MSQTPAEIAVHRVIRHAVECVTCWEAGGNARRFCDDGRALAEDAGRLATAELSGGSARANQAP